MMHIQSRDERLDQKPSTAAASIQEITFVARLIRDSIIEGCPRTAVFLTLFFPLVVRLRLKIRANPGLGDQPSPFLYTIR
jgi:hypothetical protein